MGASGGSGAGSHVSFGGGLLKHVTGEEEGSDSLDVFKIVML